MVGSARTGKGLQVHVWTSDTQHNTRHLVSQWMLNRYGQNSDVLQITRRVIAVDVPAPSSVHRTAMNTHALPVVAVEGYLFSSCTQSEWKGKFNGLHSHCKSQGHPYRLFPTASLAISFPKDAIVSATGWVAYATEMYCVTSWRPEVRDQQIGGVGFFGGLSLTYE